MLFVSKKRLLGWTWFLPWTRYLRELRDKNPGSEELVLRRRIADGRLQFLHDRNEEATADEVIRALHPGGAP
jgi:hypothetical protein